MKAKNSVIGLSIVSVLVMTVFLNEWIVSSQDHGEISADGNRGIASFDDRDSVEGVKWEHELAQKLAQEKAAAKSLLAVKPTLKDELVFGFLEGKYKTHMVDSKIQGFNFTNNQAGDQPLVIKEKVEFLKIFKSVFNVDYAKVQFASRDANKEIYKLISSNNKDLGEAHFQLDDEGRVLSLQISR